MPSEFAFFVNDELRFAEPMKSIQCEGISKNGHRCQRQTVIGSPFCWNHLLSAHHLRIKESRIPHAGKGLFVMKPDQAPRTPVFRKNDLVVRYYGEHINKNTLDERYGEYTAPYGIQIQRDEYEDGAMQRGVGSLLNHVPRARTNVEFKVRGPWGQRYIALIAKKNIYDGDELLVNYGRDYRFHEPTRYTVRYRRHAPRRGRGTHRRRPRRHP